MLTIYRASAGAGKTHRLTGEYLTLLFSRPYAYRRILAVTFTNKATAEMKQRVVSALHDLATGKPSGYMADLSTTYSLTEADIRKQARKILIEILHDYSAFNISTIDHFFQQTMRAFTRELGLQGGYGIEMDENMVLTEAVDRFMADLERPENKASLNWLLRFAERKIEEGGNWNIRRDILSLSRELFRESYRSFSAEVNEDIADKEALDAYENDLYALMRAVEADVKQIGEEGLSVMRQFGLEPTDFKNGSRSALCHFEKWAKGEMKEPTNTFLSLADQAENYYTKTMSKDRKEAILNAYAGGLNDKVKEAISLQPKAADYHTAREIIRHFYTLGILTDVSRHIAEYREDKNVMLIADTTELLNRVIDGSDTPFIYEKTGTRVDHYMIDEFQDTSAMQWANFLPLVRESLGNGWDNLIVGDVKQSIYRFRNSDWTLLDEQVLKDFRSDSLKEKPLLENWRSCKAIVEFNNALFTHASSFLQDFYNQGLSNSSLGEQDRVALSTKITQVYHDCAQQVAPKFEAKNGHVRVDFLAGEGKSDWKGEALSRLPSLVEALQDKGYALRDIAILVRKNEEGASVANTLLGYKEANPSGRYRYDVLSNDALYISNSPAVRFIVAALRYLVNPSNPALYAVMRHAYQVLTDRFGEKVEESLFEPLRSLSRQSLYETSEGIFRLFADRFPDADHVFTQAFLDRVLEYTQHESPDINRFLEYWEERGCKETLSTPEGQDAIQILTVHKAKGLGFKVVIIPFCDWTLDHASGNGKQGILWCHPDRKPFHRLRLVPVVYSQKLPKTWFAKDYFKERLHTFIDNLNALYVSFTRAKEELIVFAPRPDGKKKSGKEESLSTVAQLLWKTFTQRMREGFSEEEGRYEVGKDWLPTNEASPDTPVEEIPMTRLPSVSVDQRLRLRLRGKGFFFDDKRRKHGTLMHELLSRIRVVEDLPATIEDYRLAGVIDREEADALSQRLGEALRDPRVAPWYDGTARVLNEVDILLGNGMTQRPDRVMIQGDSVVVVDYKFGNHKLERYRRQVCGYLSLIQSMGYSTVKGYLWYVELKEIEAI